MSGTVIVALALLQVKHFLFDFVFQTMYQLKNKGTYGHPGGILHAGLHVFGTLLVLLVVLPPLSLALIVLIGEFVVHYHIDWGKEQIVRRFRWTDGANFWRMIGLDQLMHQLTYVAILAILFA